MLFKICLGLMSALTLNFESRARASDSTEITNWTSNAKAAPSATDGEIEQRIGPWLDLTGGGQAVGPAQGPVKVKNPDGTLTDLYGSLINGTSLPERGDSFRKIEPKSETSYGAGMMISLIENASAEFQRSVVPGNVVWVGEIAQKNGGPFGHKSHQNGLDADIAFIGANDIVTVIDPQGNVMNTFDKEKNWNFWKMLYGQQILDHGKIRSVVSMILIDPRIKVAMCAWAKERNMLADPVNIEVMRRLRPTVNHDDHFHLRLHCSPHYAQCIQDGDPSAGTGCD
jgi:penicillin-insensitive murein endopeptidase